MSDETVHTRGTVFRENRADHPDLQLLRPRDVARDIDFVALELAFRTLGYGCRPPEVHERTTLAATP